MFEGHAPILNDFPTLCNELHTTLGGFARLSQRWLSLSKPAQIRELTASPGCACTAAPLAISSSTFSMPQAVSVSIVSPPGTDGPVVSVEAVREKRGAGE